MAQNSFLSLKKDANKPELLYRLGSEWKNKSCNVTVLVEAVKDAYRGQITEDEVRYFSQKLKFTEEEYVEKLKHSLSPYSEDDRFFYEMGQDSFSIKDRVPGKKSIRRILANIKLEKVDFHQLMCEMLNKAMKEIADLNTALRLRQTEKESIERNYENAVQRLNEMVRLKEEDEKVLYSRFLSLLNTKKSKIAKLENQRSTSSVNYASSDESVYSVDTDKMEDVPCESQSPLQTSSVDPTPTPMEAVSELEEPPPQEVVSDEPSYMETASNEPLVSEIDSLDDLLFDPTTRLKKS